MYLAHMKTFSSSTILRFCLIFLLGITFFSALQAQKGKPDDGLVQLSGLILDGATVDLLPVPFATIAVQDKGRGTYADYNGFFSIVVEQGDIVIFTSIGYQPVYFKVPDTLRDNRYSIVQLMTQDTFNLPETVVFPWPSREHLKIEFLAMDVTSDLQKKALENLAQENLNRDRQDLS